MKGNTIFPERKWSGEISLGFDPIFPRFPGSTTNKFSLGSNKFSLGASKFSLGASKFSLGSKARKSPRGFPPGGWYLDQCSLAGPVEAVLDAPAGPDEHFHNPTIGRPEGQEALAVTGTVSFRILAGSRDQGGKAGELKVSLPGDS